MSSLRRCLWGVLLVAAAGLAPGCAGLQKSPGRCVACCYDGCIVPTFAPQSHVRETPGPRAAPVIAQTMAY